MDEGVPNARSRGIGLQYGLLSPLRRGRQRDAARGEALWSLGALTVAGIGLIWEILNTRLIGAVFGDASAYWSAWHGPLYQSAPLWTLHFIYSPAAAVALWPAAQLPLQAFVILWWAFGAAAYVWLLAPLPLPARVVGLAAGALCAANGNIEWLLALMIVVGMRRPELWLVALFTKVAPFVGFGWFVLRGEWRAALVTGLVAIPIVIVSALLLPGAWSAWIALLVSFTSQTEAASSQLLPSIPFGVRMASAVAILLWGVRAHQPLVLPIVVALAQPDIQPWAFGLLAAFPRLRLRQHQQGVTRGQVERSATAD